MKKTKNQNTHSNLYEFVIEEDDSAVGSREVVFILRSKHVKKALEIATHYSSKFISGGKLIEKNKNHLFNIYKGSIGDNIVNIWKIISFSRVENEEKYSEKYFIGGFMVSELSFLKEDEPSLVL